MTGIFKYIQLVVIGLLCHCVAISQNTQYTGLEDDGDYKMQIKKDIFRLILTVRIPTEEDGTLTFSYERELKKPFTLVLKAGPSLAVAGLSNSDNGYRYTVNAYAAAELRYYFTLLHRIKKGKPVRNFSGLYLSAEQNIFSNPILLINEKRSDAFGGNAGAFLNIGYQKEIGRNFYFNAFVGPRLYGVDFGPDVRSLYGYHGGLAIGIVFR